MILGPRKSVWRRRVAGFVGGLFAAGAMLAWSGTVSAQVVNPSPSPQEGPVVASPQSPTPGPALSAAALVRMSPQELEALYAGAVPGPIPCGKVRGRAVVAPGSPLAGPASGAARVVWQGKIFDPASGQAVNRFFGLRVIRGNVGYGPSWRDGQPAIILDYAGTSRLYGPYRDEIRQVAPGLYLGLMFDRRTSPPALKTYFVLEDL